MVDEIFGLYTNKVPCILTLHAKDVYSYKVNSLTLNRMQAKPEALDKNTFDSEDCHFMAELYRECRTNIHASSRVLGGVCNCMCYICIVVMVHIMP